MTISELSKILNKYNIKAKKQYGQNFLLSDSIISDIVNKSNLDKETIVVEIGPGLGFLTKELAKVCKHVLCFEIDEDVIKVLNNELKEYSNITIINNDFLKCNIDDEINKLDLSYNKVKVVSNLPYYITTKILLKILEESNKVSELTVMMQKEVADRICGTPKTKDYNSLSVLMQYYTNPKVIINVPRNVFYPEPDVDSKVVSIIKKEILDIASDNEDFFKKFNRAIFAQRRKTLSNNLKCGFGYSNDLINKVLTTNNLSLSVRSEELSVKQIVTLSDTFYKEAKSCK